MAKRKQRILGKIQILGLRKQEGTDAVIGIASNKTEEWLWGKALKSSRGT